MSSSDLELVDYSTLVSQDSGQVLTVRECVVRALGGPGMLAVLNVPGVEELRRLLLPQARVLALMPDSQRKLLLKDNALGTDVPLKRPDRLVSSFATQLHFTDETESSHATIGEQFRKLGHRLAHVGVLVARLCDCVWPGLELEKTILDSQTAKGRLIHYHSENERSAATKTSPSTSEELWQQWHYDYGVLTVLTAPMFLAGGKEEVLPPEEHSSLVAMDTRTGCESFVNLPAECVLVQVGEAAQILSGGKLRATAHCVARPGVECRMMSRETFVVFLQPAWDKVLSSYCCADGEGEEEVPRKPSSLNVIPPLEQRWKTGWTFAEFSKATTRLYYGSKGIQSNKLHT